jgi:hypothetical protein
MVEAIVLLTAGVLIGRLWAWLKAETQVVECPRCAVEDEKQRTIVEISTMRRMGEAQMRQAATGGRQQQRSEPSRSYDTGEQWSSGRFGGSDGS